MDFYTSISKYYDYIFPFSPPQREFVLQNFQINSGAGILDIGCGTGNLALSLADAGLRVDAIDYDRAMIEAAENKKPSGKEYPRFHFMDMMKISGEYERESFKGVLCFGNTLVHLLNISAMKNFFTGVASLLSPGGILLLQILNYDYILDEGVDKLPPIENETITFSRSYRQREDGLLDFNTELTIMETGEMVTNSIPLLPLRKDQLLDILASTGFHQVKVFGDFKMNPLTATSLPLVVRAKRK